MTVCSGHTWLCVCWVSAAHLARPRRLCVTFCLAFLAGKQVAARPSSVRSYFRLHSRVTRMHTARPDCACVPC